MSGRFKHRKYTYTVTPWGSRQHLWETVGPTGGVSFSAVVFDPEKAPGCGLEFHHSARAGYRQDEAPDHIRCWLTGEPCWHDGTSLYASETVWPQVDACLRGGDHDEVFRLLEYEYDRHFTRLRCEATP